MGIIYGWVKNIVCFYLFFTAVLQLLPKSNYQKYVRFFGGLLLTILLLSPIVSFFHKSDNLLYTISLENFWQEQKSLQLDTEKMDALQKTAYRSQYEDAMAEDVSVLAKGAGFSVEEVQVHLGTEYQVEEIKLSLSRKEGGIYIKRAGISDNSAEYPEAEKLREKLKGLYQIEDSQIRIYVAD
ncbi:hypothetical protein FACS1894111_13420 [Clostridia bacterium]|nr:hypothetical protein FACS1894111_13420 [Clostridia bacterium]